MVIRCPYCKFSRSITLDKIPSTAEIATCPKCKQRFRFRTVAQKQVAYTDNGVKAQQQFSRQNAQAADHISGNPPDKEAEQGVSVPQEPEKGRLYQAERENAPKQDIWDKISSLGRLWEKEKTTEPESDSAMTAHPEQEEPDPAATWQHQKAETHRRQPISVGQPDQMSNFSAASDMESQLGTPEPEMDTQEAFASPSQPTPSANEEVELHVHYVDGKPTTFRNPWARKKPDIPAAPYDSPPSSEPQESSGEPFDTSSYGYNDQTNPTPHTALQREDDHILSQGSFNNPYSTVHEIDNETIPADTDDGKPVQAEPEEKHPSGIAKSENRDDDGDPMTLIAHGKVLADSEGQGISPHQTSQELIFQEPADGALATAPDSVLPGGPADDPVSTAVTGGTTDNSGLHEPPSLADTLPPNKPFSYSDVTPEELVEKDILLLQTDQERPTRNLGVLSEPSAEQVVASFNETREIPWEHPGRYGVFSSLGRTVKNVMFSAPAFFRTMPSSGGLAFAFLFFILHGYIAVLCTTLWIILASVLFDLPALAQVKDLVPAIALFTPVGLGLLLIAATSCTRIFLILFNSPQASFTFTFKLLCYSLAPLILSIILFVGPIAGLCWSCIALATACHHSTGLSALRSFITVLPACLLILGALYILL